jgi:hypothetical protein
MSSDSGFSEREHVHHKSDREYERAFLLTRDGFKKDQPFYIRGSGEEEKGYEVQYALETLRVYKSYARIEYGDHGVDFHPLSE